MSNTNLDSPTAVLVTQMLENSEHAQRDIGYMMDLGLSKTSAASVFTNIKSGRSPLPVRYIRPLCQILEVQPDELFDTFMKEYHPEIRELAMEIYGKSNS